MGKSMGNGFPVAALITRRCITQKFDKDGIEYFNTYGGNPVSCRAAIAVLDVIEREKLMDNARDVGNYLLNKLKELGKKYDIIGDVRGRGFFLGVEIVRDPKKREPGIEEAHEIKYKLREHMIIISLDGPKHNVIKFKPPMSFSKLDADFLCDKLETIVRECQNKKDEKQETYICSQYRTFTKYQLKAKIYHDGTYQIFYSQHHEHFKQWLGSARLLNYSNMLPPIFCSCKYGLKEYSCIHTIGLMMIWGVRPIPQLIGKRNPK
ncbi:unnamed protein product, partial [Rotaria sp. Silwood1]